MKFNTSLLAAAFIAAGFSACGSVVFQNTGTRAGWDYISEQNQGTCAEVTSPVYKGTTAVRARQIFVANSSERFHSELGKYNVGQRGNDRYFGWAFRLPSTWQFTNGKYIISQLGVSYSGLSCSGEPLSKSFLQGTTLKIEITTGAPCSSSAVSYTVFSGVTAGVWHRNVYRYKLASDSTGIVEYWYDGVKRWTRNGANITSTSNQLRWSIGLYCPEWYQKSSIPDGGQTTREVVVDHARVATSYSEAEPANWDTGTTGVTFYSSVNYGGTAGQVLAKGTYTLSQLAAKGIANDSASSVKIPSGWTVTIYQNDNFGGTSWVRTSDTPDFTSISGLNDAMSSCRIE